jgi:hypothetical protein
VRQRRPHQVPDDQRERGDMGLHGRERRASSRWASNGRRSPGRAEGRDGATKSPGAIDR